VAGLASLWFSKSFCQKHHIGGPIVGLFLTLSYPRGDKIGRLCLQNAFLHFSLLTFLTLLIISFMSINKTDSFGSLFATFFNGTVDVSIKGTVRRKLMRVESVINR
jgi:hypothetical protein